MPVVHTPLVAAPAISYGIVKAPEAVEKVEVKAEAKVNLAKIIDGKKSQNLGIFLKV